MNDTIKALKRLAYWLEVEQEARKRAKQAPYVGHHFASFKAEAKNRFYQIRMERIAEYAQDRQYRITKDGILSVTEYMINHSHSSSVFGELDKVKDDMFEAIANITRPQ